MIFKRLFFFAVMSLSACCTGVKMDSTGRTFKKGKDFLLVQFDCKTDVDDLQTVAALATLLSDSNFTSINYHAVAGTYMASETELLDFVPLNSLIGMIKLPILN